MTEWKKPRHYEVRRMAQARKSFSPTSKVPMSVSNTGTLLLLLETATSLLVKPTWVVSGNGPAQHLQSMMASSQWSFTQPIQVCSSRLSTAYANYCSRFLWWKTQRHSWRFLGNPSTNCRTQNFVSVLFSSTTSINTYQNQCQLVSTQLPVPMGWSTVGTWSLEETVSILQFHIPQFQHSVSRKSAQKRINFV